MRTTLIISLIWAAFLAAASPSSAVSMNWIDVHSPGNAGDTTGHGSVDYAYSLGRFEVTNAEYAVFLNAVAATSDPGSLWSSSMASSNHGGIDRNEEDGRFAYDAPGESQEKPVNFVTYYDGLRFANWLHNGSPNGTQGTSTTEDGAYTLFGPSLASDRLDDAKFFLPSEDEWYKAAYYDPHSMSYSAYPMGSDTAPFCTFPPGSADAANCHFVVKALTDVGAYSNASSAFDTFDQGGNVAEWTEGVLGLERIVRGGSFLDASSTDHLAAVSRVSRSPEFSLASVGFRIAAVQVIPEPSTGLLLAGGLIALALDRRGKTLGSGS